MADKTTPGGVLHDPVSGGRLDAPSALNVDACLRELAAGTGSVAAESEARDDTLAARIDSELTRLTTTHMTRTDDGRIVFQQGGVLPVSRASDGRLVVAA